jgi:hypothetical protein
MFPFAHYFIAEEMFGKLNNEIKLGSIIPDFISLGPNITIEDTHKVLEDFGNPDFERAWNLHIIVDEYTEENYSYPNSSDELRRDLGAYLAHIFVEAAVDYSIWNTGKYYEPPVYDEDLINKLENVLGKDLTIVKPTLILFLTWDPESYFDNLVNSLLYIAGSHQHVLTKSQVKMLINECVEIIPDYKILLNDSMQYLKLNKHQQTLGR